jgi:hypothetical protein
MKHGLFNFLPLVNEYEAKNPQLKPVLKDAGLTDRELKTREKKLINSNVQFACRVQLIPSRFGKMPSTLKNAIFIEYDNFAKLLAEYLPEPLDQN